MVVILLVASALQGRSPDTLAISPDDATRRAVSVSPSVAAALGGTRGARGLRAESWWPFPDNPSLEYGRIRRTTPGSLSYDRNWSVTQEIEIAGQWALRGGAANALVHSAEARLEDARRIAALEARRTYGLLTLAELRVALTDSAAALADRLAQFARRQFEVGETNRLEMNAAVLDAARARSTAERTAADAAGAAADLGRVLGLPADTVPRTSGLQSIPDLRWSSDSALVRLAIARRPDLRAAQTARVGMERRLTLTRLGLIPNLAVSLVSGREGGTDQLFGLTLGLRVPLFYRQQAAVGQAAAERAAALADETIATRAIQAEVLSAAARFRRARAAERRFETEVLLAANENVTLTERALTEGEVGLTEVLVLRNTAVAAQLEYLDVVRDAADAWFTLAAALAVEPADLPTLIGTGD